MGKELTSENKIKDLLIELGICSNETIVDYFPKVRDRDDVSVMKCTRSGVIFLSRSDHMDISHYAEKEDFKYWGTDDRKAALLSGLEDAQRRYDQFKLIVANKKWVDIGTGAGGILDLLSVVAAETAAVEPQESARECLKGLGYDVYPSIDSIKDDAFEIVTLFHVLEHFTDPISALTAIRQKMRKNAKIVIEIPHAGDFLISFLENDTFKAFTFWSEHLLLHTRESITALLKKTGFSNIVVTGFQRYPLANHLHWLSEGKPGGHIAWPFLRTANLDHEYAAMLASLDKTDTLIITAENC